MNIIEIDGWDSVEEALMKLSAQRPEWFPDGFKGIHAVADDNLFAGTLGGWLYFSDADTMVAGFKPATELKNALLNIASGKALAFNEEYAVETLWHEILHSYGRHTARPMKANLWQAFESIVQLSARHTYPKLMGALGGSVWNQESIIHGGISYANATSNLRTLIVELGLEERATAESISGLIKPGVTPDELPHGVAQLLADKSGHRMSKIQYALKRLELQFGFKEKIRRKLGY